MGLFISCGKPLPTLSGVNLEMWKEDKNGCNGVRKSMETSLRLELVKLKGLSEMDIISMFGRPDENELYKRNQKFYYYFVTPGPGCAGSDSVSTALSLRFNAMGYAQLVAIDKR